jgi:hypothetical protein
MSSKKINLTSLPFKPRTEKKKGKLRSRISNFHITLNTNVRYDKSLESLISGLQKSVGQSFTDPDSIKEYVTFPKGGEWNDDFIEGVDVVTGVEIGRDDAHGARLHCHVQFKVKHHSFLRLDFTKIKEVVNDRLKSNDFPHPIAYVHVVCHKPELADYMSKDN